MPQSFASELPNGLAVDAQGQIWFAAEAPVVTLPPILYVFDRQGDIAPPRTRLDFNPRDLAFDRAGRGFMLDGLGARLVTDFDRRSGSYLALPIQRGARALAVGSAGEVWLLDGPSSEHEGGISGLTVALAHGLHCSRVDGSALIYNQADTYMPDLLICHQDHAAQVLEIVRSL